MKRRYGFLGFVSLIGLLGFWTRNPMYFPFLGFAVFFEYFFVKTDEMFMDHMRKAAAWAFFSNLATAVAATCYYAVMENHSDDALIKGIGLGFGAAIMVFCLMSAYFDWKEQRGVAND